MRVWRQKETERFWVLGGGKAPIHIVMTDSNKKEKKRLQNRNLNHSITEAHNDNRLVVLIFMLNKFLKKIMAKGQSTLLKKT